MTEDVKGQPSPATPEKPADDKKAGVEGSQTLTVEDVQKIVQSETDRVRTELHKKLKEREAEIEDLKKSKMSEKEQREYAEQKLQEREQLLTQKELTLVATDSLKDSGLPTEFREFVIAGTADATKERVIALKDVFQKAVEAAVQEKFKAAGHDPKKGTEPPASVFTRDRLKTMSREEIQQNLPEIQRQMAAGLVK